MYIDHYVQNFINYSTLNSSLNLFVCTMFCSPTIQKKSVMDFQKQNAHTSHTHNINTEVHGGPESIKFTSIVRHSGRNSHILLFCHRALTVYGQY